MKPIIETERLILREFTMDDCEAVFEFNSNLELHQYTGDEVLQSVDRAKEIIRDIWLEDYKNYGYGRWATIYKPEDKIIGFAGLKYLPELNQTDIGFRFLPSYWGKGLATEASREILKYGFDKLGIDEIIGIAMPENIGSCRVLEKIGLKLYKKAPYDDDEETKRESNWYKMESAHKPFDKD